MYDGIIRKCSALIYTILNSVCNTVQNNEIREETTLLICYGCS